MKRLVRVGIERALYGGVTEALRQVCVHAFITPFCQAKDERPAITWRRFGKPQGGPAVRRLDRPLAQGVPFQEYGALRTRLAVGLFERVVQESAPALDWYRLLGQRVKQ